MSPATRTKHAWARDLVCAAAIILLGSGSSAWAGVTVSLTAPASGATFNAPANIALTASAATTSGYRVSKVEFFSGSTLIGTDTSAPYSFAWNNVSAGSYALTAKATATKSGSPTQTATSSVVNIAVVAPPILTVALTSPGNGAVLDSTLITLSATTSTTQGYSVSKVEFFRDTVLIATTLGCKG